MLQHFVGNRMSIDIMMLVLGDPIEWMLGFSIGSKYLGSSLDASLDESYMPPPKTMIIDFKYNIQLFMKWINACIFHLIIKQGFSYKIFLIMLVYASNTC